MSYTGVAILVNRDTSFDAMYRVEYFAQASTIIGNVFGVGWYVNSSEATVSMFPSVVPKDFFTSHVFNEWVKNWVIVSTSPHILFQGD